MTNEEERFQSTSELTKWAKTIKDASIKVD
jgi:hypothetical protein